MKLTEQLLNVAQTMQTKLPTEVQAEIQKAHEELVSQKIASESISVGDVFPDFALQNQHGEKQSLNSLLENSRFLILSFYRGGWCPYCNLELKALQENLSDFEQLRAKLVAISPELPDALSQTTKTNAVDYHVLSDERCELAEKIGISFELPENLKPIYSNFGIDVPAHNGENNYTLPVPATFLINSSKEVVFAFKDLDYKQRLDPADLIQKIQTITQ